MKYISIILIVLLTGLELFSQEESSLPANYIDYPDPLKITGKLTIANATDWIHQKKKILDLFSENIYGNYPEPPDSLSFEIIKEKKLSLGSPCIFKNIKITVIKNGNSASFHTLIYIPVRQTPVPVFVLINHRKQNSFEPENSYISEYWPADKIIEEGFATAMLVSHEVSPDDPDEFQIGVISELFPCEINKPNGMKTISAWAWGASRVLDYLETDSLINTQKAAIIGHSRSGKAALWCGANDERFTLVISNNSGNSGAALARRSVGEQISDINKRFPHWFCDNYNTYNEDVNNLPVDQHILLALVAPRSLYLASASEDEWADPMGEFYALNMAVPVYKLFNPTISYLEFPKDNNSIHTGQIGYHLRNGKHGLTLSDWKKYMVFFRKLNWKCKN